MTVKTKNNIRYYSDIYAGDLSGTLTDITEQFHEWADQFGVEVNQITYYYDGYDEIGYLSYEVPLTAEEIAKNKAKDAAAAQAKAERKAKADAKVRDKELAELQRLRKKYPDV